VLAADTSRENPANGAGIVLDSVSIKRKLGIVILATTAIALLMACIAFALSDYANAREALRERMHAHARVIGAASASAIAEGDAAAGRRLLASLGSDPDIVTVSVDHADGREFARFPAVDGRGPASGESVAFMGGNTGQVSFVEPLTVDGQTIGSVSIAASDAGLGRRIASEAGLAALVSLAGLAIAWFMSRRFAATISKPVHMLSGFARRVRETRDYSLRAAVGREDELGRLAVDFNGMLAAFEQSYLQLEDEVEQRTHELERRNLELRNEITERAKTEQRLSRSEQLFKSTFDRAAIGMFLLFDQRDIAEVNQAFSSMLGYEPAELNGVPVVELTHPDDREIGLDQYRRLRSGQIDHYQIEKRYCHRDGHVVWVLAHVTAARDDCNRYKHAIAQVIDITEAHQLSKELSYQASHDPLTGLVNRREFEERIESALESALRDQQEHAICYLDLDQFKVINDTCGHVAGDELLRQIANLLRSKLRSNDTVARLGGDEFGLLMEGCPLIQSQRVAETLRAAIEQFQFVWDDKRFRVGVSIGVVPINEESSSIMEVLQQADTACYAAKDLGRNRVHLYLREDQELAKRHGEMQWVTKIQEALDARRFRLYIQPIVPVRLSELGYEHYEVLIRMVESDGSEIPPGAFLPAAERYNLAARIDRWVLASLLEWLDLNRDVADRISMCSVNLSGLTLADESFLAYVVKLLDGSGVSSQKLCFEITETAVISNLSQASRFISTLKGLGCQFALDDFGSGLSSFAYLKSLPVDYLKIDGMFVRDIHTDPIDRALVKSINDVGKVMGKKTIAEFVENNDVLQILAEIGVDYGQGYGIGKPFPLDDLAAAIAAPAVAESLAVSA
jgi:diguanylate cyclase (GGDEF)-like protein/PAS domain S-box-containing protein